MQLLLQTLAVLAGAPAAPVALQAPDTGAFIAGEYVSAEGRRRYKLFVPARKRNAPLIVLLHGCTQHPDDLARGTRFNQHATRAGALVLYPDQPVEANGRKCWNWFDPAHQAPGAGEPALIAGMTREVVATYRADSRRVYIGGISAGAAMAVLTAVAYPDLYAAVAAHSGLPWRAAQDLASGLAAMQGKLPDSDSLARAAREAMAAAARAVPLIALHGTRDSILRPAATHHLVEQFVALHELVRPGGPRPASTSTIGGAAAGYPVRVRRYRDADGRAVIEEWLIDGLGHAWSGGSPEGSWTDARGPDATAEIMRFFLEHTSGE